jgi:hypothetical protein
MLLATLLIIFVVGVFLFFFLSWNMPPAGATGTQVDITAQNVGDGDVGNAGVLGPVLVVGLVIASIKKIVDFPAYIKAQDWNAVTKTVLPWLAGVAFAFHLQATDFARDLQLAGVVLADTNAATVILFGLSLGSTASVGSDVLAAVDNTRSSAVPPLVDPAPPA